MKATATIVLILVLSVTICFTGWAESPDDDMSWGLHLMAGARYDDLRMCVGSPAGVKGGPIVDGYLDLRFPAGENAALAVNIPVIRPILFAVAFKMLQFEPQVTYEYHFGDRESSHLVLGGGLGAIFHYGPDYTTDKDSPGPSFFAAGPLFSVSAGLEIPSGKGYWMPGLKIFYAPLFSADYPVGTVAGGALELHYIFGK